VPFVFGCIRRASLNSRNHCDFAIAEDQRILSLRQVLVCDKDSSGNGFIDGSVIDNVGARGFLKLIEAEPVYFIGFPSKEDLVFVVHKPYGELPARHEVKR
jgi:hypothetical protein